MSTDITTAQDCSTIQAVLKNPAVVRRLESILKDRAPQFASSLISLVNESNQLLKCSPNSIMASAMVAATLNLPIQKNLGFAYLVPYGSSAQFQMGAKGFIQLAMRTGQYARMNAEGINSEAFIGYDDIGEPLIDWGKFDPTQPIDGFVFAFKLVNGFSKTIYWTRERCLKHAKQFSKAYQYDLSAKKSLSPWSLNEDAMCLKTVVKTGLSKWGILSVELQTALKEDQSARDTLEGEGKYIDTEALSDDPEGPSLADGVAVTESDDDKLPMEGENLPPKSDGGPLAAPKKGSKA